MDASKLFFEFGALKRVARSGWWLAGVKNPESVAEHSFRTALIARVLAELEGLSEEDSQKAVLLCLFHDVPEARCNDLHKLGSTYFGKCQEKALEKAAEDQALLMPQKTAGLFLAFLQEFKECKTRAAIIAKDADLVEVAFQAKEYSDCGFSGVCEWIQHARESVKTRAAGELLRDLEKNSSCWFEKI